MIVAWSLWLALAPSIPPVPVPPLEPLPERALTPDTASAPSTHASMAPLADPATEIGATEPPAIADDAATNVATSEDPSAEVGHTDELEASTVYGRSEATVLRQSAYPVTVIDPARFSGRAIGLNEVIARSAGIRVRQTGGAGSPTSYSIRGFEGKRVQVFINGRPLASPSGTFTIDDIPIQLIERVEIYKGIVPAKLGGDSLGGAVNIVLKEVTRDYLDVKYSYDTAGVHRGYVVGKKFDHAHGFAASAGIVVTFAENDYVMQLPDGRRVRRNHDGYDQEIVAGSFDLQRAWFDVFEINWATIHSKKQIQGVPGQGIAGTERDVREAHTRSSLYFAGVHLEKHELWKGFDLLYNFAIPGMVSRFRDLATTVHDFSGQSRPSPSGRGEVGFGPNDSRDRRLDIRQQINLNQALGDHHRINLNHILRSSMLRPSDPVADEHAGRPITPRPGRMLSSALGLTHEMSILDDRLVTTIGGKYYAFSSRGTATDIYAVTATRAEEQTSRTHTWGVNGGARVRLLDGWMVRFGYERAVRLPTSEELFGDGALVQGAPGLAPEHGHNIVGGTFVDKVWPRGRTLQLEVDGFWSRVDDYIVLGGALTPAFANVGQVTSRGATASLASDVMHFFYIYGNLTYQDVRNTAEVVPGTTQPNFLRGLRVPNIPVFFANWGAELIWADVFRRFGAPSKIKIFYDGTFVDEYFFEYRVSERQERKIPAYASHSTGVQVSFKGDRYVASVSMHNLADAPQFDQFNRPLPGRSFRFFFRTTLF